MTENTDGMLIKAGADEDSVIELNGKRAKGECLELSNIQKCTFSVIMYYQINHFLIENNIPRILNMLDHL